MHMYHVYVYVYVGLHVHVPNKYMNIALNIAHEYLKSVTFFREDSTRRTNLSRGENK